MNPVAATLVVIALAITLGVLFAGIFSMARGGEFARKHSNKLMRWRVIAQGVAVLFFVIGMLIGKD